VPADWTRFQRDGMRVRSCRKWVGGCRGRPRGRRAVVVCVLDMMPMLMVMRIVLSRLKDIAAVSKDHSSVAA